MSRYIIRSAKPGYIETPLWEDAKSHCRDVTVDTHEAVFTGLLNKSGDEIWRAPNPMGFGRDVDW